MNRRFSPPFFRASRETSMTFDVAKSCVALVVFTFGQGMWASAAAQTLSGVTLGDPLVRAQAALPRAAYAAIDGQPDRAMLWTDSVNVSLCRGTVTSVSQLIGNTIHDFTSIYEKISYRRGDATISIRNYRTSMGEISYVVASWKGKDGNLTLQFTIQGAKNGKVEEVIGNGGSC